MQPRTATSDCFPDRCRLSLRFDPARLAGDLARLAHLDGGAWTQHFVQANFTGDWSAIPLRAPAGVDHPILMIAPHPGISCVDAPALERTPYLQTVLAAFECPLRAVRLMLLGPGSSILEHRDPGLRAEEGAARLHIPVSTNPAVRFYLSDQAVAMAPGEVWYLRLSDPHRVDNFGTTARVHLVIDADVNDWLARQLRSGAAVASGA